MNPARTIPEGVKTITAEGKDLSGAIAAAAETIGVEAVRVEFKFDMAHFRSATGASVAKKSVKILAWPTSKSDEEIEALKAKSAPRPERAPRDRDRDDRPPREAREERAERAPREERAERPPREDREERRGRERGGRDRDRGRGRDRDRGDRGDRGDRDEERRRPSKPVSDTPLEETKASAFASAWFTKLLEMMSIEGTVKSGGNDERVQLWISAEKAGRLIGKRGSTLGSIRHLLGIAVVKKFGDLVIDVDVEDNRPRPEGGERERKPRDRGDRGDRGGRDRDRGDRDRDRGGRGRDKKGGGGGGADSRSRYPEAKLRALARRAAEKAAETKKTITINLELNSYDRRIVHVEVAELEGVNSRSEERDDGVKIIQVYPSDGEE